MASPTQWTWVWANSGRRWRTAKPGVLHSMGSQRVGHDLATEQQQKIHPHTPQRKSAPLRWWVSSVLFNFLDFARMQISVDSPSSETGSILESSYKQMHRLVLPPRGSGLIYILPFWPGANGWYIFEGRETMLMESWFQNIESAKRPAKESTLPSHDRGKKQNRKVRLNAVKFLLWPRKEWTLMFTLCCFYLSLLSLMLNILSFKGRWQKNREAWCVCTGWGRISSPLKSEGWTEHQGRQMHKESLGWCCEEILFIFMLQICAKHCAASSMCSRGEHETPSLRPRESMGSASWSQGAAPHPPARRPRGEWSLNASRAGPVPRTSPQAMVRSGPASVAAPSMCWWHTTAASWGSPTPLWCPLGARAAGSQGRRGLMWGCCPAGTSQDGPAAARTH